MSITQCIKESIQNEMKEFDENTYQNNNPMTCTNTSTHMILISLKSVVWIVGIVQYLPQKS